MLLELGGNDPAIVLPGSDVAALAPQLFAVDPTGGLTAGDGEEEGAADAYIVFSDEGTQS